MNEETHVTHCCIHHGCKYGDDECPVESGIRVQEHPCEECGWRPWKIEQALKFLVGQFEDNYMLDGEIVDNPCTLLVKCYEEAKEALDTEETW